MSTSVKSLKTDPILKKDDTMSGTDWPSGLTVPDNGESLGKDYEFSKSIDSESGEIIYLNHNLKPIKDKFVRNQKVFAMRDASGRILAGGQNGKPILNRKGKMFRTVFCGRRKIEKNKKVRLVKTEFGSNFQNVQLCASSWICPFCVRKLSEIRKHEIQVASDIHSLCGGSMYFVTFTFRHNSKNKLSDFLESEVSGFGLLYSFSLFRKHRKTVSIMKSNNLIGFVRGLEITWNDRNGWHPHLHILFFFSTNRKNLNIELSNLFDVWKISCRRARLGIPTKEHGMDVRRSFGAAEYLCKFEKNQSWSTADEMARQVQKTGRQGSLGPFEILELAAKGDQKFINLWIEFSKCTQGKSFIRWSKGLRMHFGLNEKSDEELVNQEEDAPIKDELYIPDVVFRTISKYRLMAPIQAAMSANRDAALSLIRSYMSTFGLPMPDLSEFSSSLNQINENEEVLK